jgi:hypothetical protein
MIDLVVPHRAFALSSFLVTVISFSETTTSTFGEKSKDNSPNGHFTTIVFPSTLASTFSSKETGDFHILDIFLFFYNFINWINSIATSLL